MAIEMGMKMNHRAFKKFDRKMSDPIHMAYLEGEYYGQKRRSCRSPKAYGMKNPYPAGRRHDAFEDGLKVALMGGLPA